MDLDEWEEANITIEMAFDLSPKVTYVEWVILSQIYTHQHKKVLKFIEAQLIKYPDNENFKYFHNVALFLNKDIYNSYDGLKQLHDKTGNQHLKKTIKDILEKIEGKWEEDN